MAYQGYYFIYDGTPSKLYGLRICSFESSGFRYPGGSSMELITDRATHSLKAKVLGSIPSKPLEFPLEIMCEREINPFQVDMIKSWLFGQEGYKKLFILNNEMNDVYFNCKFNDPEDIQINGNNGWAFTVICDAGGAWELPKTKRYTPEASSGVVTINNVSGNYGYIYPDVSFALGASETGFSIVNQSDDNREFKFTGLVGAETIHIGGETKIITSSTALERISNFNKNYLRLVRGVNKLICNGSISYLDITTQNFRRLGG